MLAQHQKNPKIKDPSWELFTTIEHEVLEVRSSLLGELDRVSPKISIAAKEMLDDKLMKVNTPLLGELFPWIIQDITGLDKDVTKRVAVGWLALYIYTIFLDEYLDGKKEISPEEFLAGSLLAKIGLLNLHEIVIGTKFQNVFDDALIVSADGQLHDVVFKSKQKNMFDLEDTAKKKNYLLMTCASALAALSDENSEVIIEFAMSLLLIFQYLDDLADWEEDIHDKRITLVFEQLSEYLSEIDFVQVFELSHDQVLERLISSGSLIRVLNRISELLSSSLMTIATINYQQDKSPSWKFFLSLEQELNHLQSILGGIENSFSSLPVSERV